jgi:subtilisin-like proprotein convertase family protein
MTGITIVLGFMLSFAAASLKDKQNFNVEIDITHTYDADLDITIESPSGTIVLLTSDNGGSGNDYTTTVFNDEASTAITAGSAPFTGSYQPEGSLSDFDGESPTGDWILHVTDDANGDTGTLNNVKLYISTEREVPWEYVGEASITYKAGSTVVVSSYYSANPSNDTGNKIRITRSTVSGSGTIGDILAYSATSPPRGGTTTLNSSTQEYWISLNAFYHDDANLTDGTVYYYKLWKAGAVESGQQNYSVVPILINE